MATKTTNFELTKPSADDFYDIEVHNENMDTIDAALEDAYNNFLGVQTNINNSIENHKKASNPHNITPSTIGLNNVNNTSDVNKPVSTAQASAIAKAKEEANATALNYVSNSMTGHRNEIAAPSAFGHAKVINNLTQASHVDGTALSAYQGKVLKDMINSDGNEFIGKFTGKEITVNLAKEYRLLKIFFFSATRSGNCRVYPPYVTRTDANTNRIVSEIEDGFENTGYFGVVELVIYRTNNTEREIIATATSTSSSSNSCRFRPGIYSGNTNNPNAIYITTSTNLDTVDAYVYGVV